MVALFKSWAHPRELSVLMEGESLLNDGTSIVVFTLILAAVSGGNVHVARARARLRRHRGGRSCSSVSPWGSRVAEVIKRIDDPMIEITLTTIAAYGSFVAAEHFGVSGVIATVAAGMLCGNYAAARGMSPSTRIAVETFWEYMAFALNSHGVPAHRLRGAGSALLDAWLPILVAYLAVLRVAGGRRGRRDRARCGRAAGTSRGRGRPCSGGAGCAGGSRWCWR